MKDIDLNYSAIYLEYDEVEVLENEFDSDHCNDLVESLIENEILEEDIHIGIAKLFLAVGYEKLSEKQKLVFKRYILMPNLCKCRRCEEFIWEECSFIEDEGLCTYCSQCFNND